MYVEEDEDEEDGDEEESEGDVMEMISEEEDMEQNLATNLLIMEVVENLATNLLTEEDLMAMEANPAIDPTPTVSQTSNPATELQATIRSIPVAIGNPVIKTIYSHLKQCKYVISFCVFL